MDELSNENLKKVFSKLGQYESSQQGISWHELRRHLEGNSGWSKAILLSLILLISFTPSGIEPKNVDSDVDQTSKHSAQTFENTTARNLVAKDRINSSTFQENTSNKFTQVKVASEVQGDFEMSNAMTAVQNDIEPYSVKPHDELQVVNIDMPIEEELKPIAQVVLVDSISLIEIESIELAENEGNIRNTRIGLSIAPFYLFGVVAPLSTDNLVLNKYNAKPGYGFEIDITFPFISRPTGILELGPSFMIVRKNFEFDILNYGTESISESEHNLNLKAQYLGWKIQYRFINQGWSVGSTLYKSLSNYELNKFMGTSLIFFHAAKEIQLNDLDLIVYIKGSGGIPVSGNISVFRYSPLQIEVGMRKNFKLFKRRTIN